VEERVSLTNADRKIEVLESELTEAKRLLREVFHNPTLALGYAIKEPGYANTPEHRWRTEARRAIEEPEGMEGP
jgi:hypothetical protein